MDTLRIAFFCWESLYSVRVGGLAAAATHLAESLAKDHEVHFFTPAIDGHAKMAEINGVSYHRCHPSGGNIVEYCKNMSLEMVEDYMQEEKNGSFDILHFHDWHITEALHSLRDRSTVLTFHSTEYGRSGNTFGNWWEFKEISDKEWYAGLMSRKVTTVSHALRDEVKHLYDIPDWKIDAVPNGIHPGAFYRDVDKEEVKKEYGIPPHVPVILFVGRLTYQKGPDILLDAVPEVLKHQSDTRFIFAGDGDMRSHLKSRITGLNGTAKFPGYLSDDEFVRILNACDILVIPSRNEPFGLVLLEAWSARKCAVATDVGGLSENIDNYVNGVKVPVDPGSIAVGINHVLDYPSTMQDMGRKGREKLEKEFRWDVISKKMLKVYSTVSDYA